MTTYSRVPPYGRERRAVRKRDLHEPHAGAHQPVERDKPGGFEHGNSLRFFAPWLTTGARWMRP